ncbi:MAG: DASH complex subunit spc19 [Ramalina farinacea]|uniref:DASH complex subunit SPC19 n=1 Tax=Ramalina farinacea TaxID=258253 RepID=A0AA43TPY1_9LECA|nr:DASH complex subunit spc19 [Ramalina farinacea]
MSNSLTACVSSLRSTNALLSSSTTILDNGVNDFPRLAKVLQTTRHFDLLPDLSIQHAQSQLLSHLTPELNALLARISAHLDRKESRQRALVARSELLEGRIGEEGRSGGSGIRMGKGGGGGAGGEGKGGLGDKKRGLRQKRERLGYVVERLELQAKQKERQLRMSVAAT